MIHLSQGVLPGSRIYFHNPSQTARNTFFYPLCTGQFYCDGAYQVNRSSYDSFLVMLVQKGGGSVTFQGRATPVSAGDVVFLDCYQPHRYETRTGWDILWLHIDGPQCRGYYNLSACSGSPVISIKDKRLLQSVEKPLQFIFHTFAHNMPCPEAALSKYITDILTVLVTADRASGLQHTAAREPCIETILAYIREHFQEPLTVENLAAQASLSPYYFIRLFKKETEMTPHQYLSALRVNSAKFYLRTTSSTVKEIGFLCGFRSENNFCIAFRKHTGLTPGEYRELDSI